MVNMLVENTRPTIVPFIGTRDSIGMALLPITE